MRKGRLNNKNKNEKERKKKKRRNTSQGTMVTFDLMTVNLKKLPQLPFLIPPLVQLHKEELNIIK